MYPIHAYVHTYIHTYTGTYKSGACTQRFERSIHGVKTRGMNRGKNTPAFFASLSRSCRHGIENYPPPPSFAPLRSSLLILSCLHFRERLFLLAIDLSVPSSFFNTEIYFLLSYSHETTPSPPHAAHRCTTDLSLSLSRFLESNNRLRHSFFSSSSMNLCLQQLCKKKGGQGKKKKGKEYRVFPRTKPGLSQPDAPDTISLFIFLLLLLDEKELSFETFQPVDISRSTNGRRAPFGFFIPFAG